MSDIKFVIVYDTYCGWCYGAHPVFDALVNSGADVETYHRHLFQGANAHRMADGFGAQAETYDARIGEMSGQPFSEDYVNNILRSDSEVLESKLTAQAAHLIRERGAKAELDLAARLQKQRYVEGVSAANRDMVVAALIAEGVSPEAAERIGSKGLAAETESSTQKAIAWMEAVGGQGVPTVVMINGDTTTAIDASRYMGNSQAITALVQ